MTRHTPAAATSQSSLTVDQAFQRLLPYFDKPGSARRQLQDAFRGDEIHLWGTLGRRSFSLPPDWFEDQVLIAADKRHDSWHVELRMHRVIDNFYHTEWTVPAEEINTLIETVKAATNASNIDSLPRKRGPKGYDTWELFKARLYISLDYDDVPHNGDINIEQRLRDDEHLTGGMRMPCAACSRCDGN